MTSGFDRLANAYRWMEYLSFGRALERCRCTLLPHVSHATKALLLGDGDGRFAERLLHAAPAVHITAVDSSTAMLNVLQARCNAPARVAVLCQDLACESLPFHAGERFDLIVSHFFLDCLSEAHVDRLVRSVKPLMARQAHWIVSEFQIPHGPMRLPAFLLIRSLYAAFRVLAELRVQKLPDYKRVLRANGFVCTEQRQMLCGVLVAEHWRLLKED